MSGLLMKAAKKKLRTFSKGESSLNVKQACMTLSVFQLKRAPKKAPMLVLNGHQVCAHSLGKRPTGVLS